MALKNGHFTRSSKRFANVTEKFHSKSEDANFSSSDSESAETLRQKKVREGSHVKKFSKRGDFFQEHGDHVYSSGKSQKSKLEYDKKPKSLQRGIKRKADENDEKPEKQHCFSRNAIMARLNRERKKLYVSSLESENEDLRKKNNEISEKIKMQSKAIQTMKNEIIYLKGLLANSKELSQILQNLKSSTGLPVTSSLVSSSNDINEDFASENIQAKVKVVSSGPNYPILDKDLNLGSYSDIPFSCSDSSDLENLPLNFESDTYNISNEFSSTMPYDSSFYNVDCNNWDWEFDEFDDSFKLDEFIKDTSPPSGICLHVNQKSISVELCSLCNSKAQSKFIQSDSF